MIRYLVRRLALLLPALIGISLVAFALLRLIPGDPAQIMLGERATAAQIAHFRADQGLDQPILIQYLRYVGRLVRGDWGRSIQTNLLVTSELAQRLPATIELGLGAMFIACIVGIPLGILAAYRRNSLLDWIVSSGTLIGTSVPLFFLGLFLSYLFGYMLNWLPPSGRLTIGVETAGLTALADSFLHLILPALTLSSVPMAAAVRMTRAVLLDALARDYTRTARAKGLSERAVLGHAMRNALPSILTVIGLQLGSLFSGAIMTETIFSWPGMGQLVVERVLARDYPVVQGIVLITALLCVTISLATDICCASLNPRIRYE